MLKKVEACSPKIAALVVQITKVESCILGKAIVAHITKLAEVEGKLEVYLKAARAVIPYPF